MRFLSSEIPRNDPRLDSMMFLRHNIGNWQEPSDMTFEASPVWHDDDAMAVDDAAKVFLQNILGKSKSQLVELKREVEKKRREVDNAKRIRQSIREGKDKRDEVEVVRAIFSMQEGLHEVERKRWTAEVEASTITSKVGDISLGAQNHNFKSQTFKIPTNCDLCGERIWGLSAKGFDCRDCGYTCHSKCEMKVPADCPGEQSKEERKKMKTERQAAANSIHSQPNGGPPDGVSELPALSRSNTMNSLSSGYAASAHRSVSGTGTRAPPEELSTDRSTPSQPAISKPNTLRKNRIVAPPPTQYVSEAPSDGLNGASGGISSKYGDPRGRMVYTYQATGGGEVSVEAGEEVTIVEQDGTYLLPTPRTITPAKRIRRLWLDDHTNPPLLWHRPSSIRRNLTTDHAFALRTPRIILLELFRLPRRQHDNSEHRQKERPRGGAEARREETKVRRGPV